MINTLTYASAAILFVFVWSRLKARKNGPLPPGPKGLPILGNIFQLSLAMWTKAEEWKEQYGPLVYINVAGQGILLLNDQTVAADLLNRRASIYSERPRWIVASEILTGGLMIVFAKQTLIWKRMRRAAHEALNRPAAAKFHAIQSKEATLLVDGLIKNPADWDAEIKRYTTSSVFSVIYDAPTLNSAADPSIAKIEDFIDRLVHSAYPGSHLVEFFPWMMAIPRRWAKWKRDAEDGFKHFSEMFEGMFHDVGRRMAEGEDRPSFAASLVRDRERHGLSDRESAWLCATIYAAGAETTSSVLSWFLLAMVAYPDAQKRCQDELDAVVGRSRLPGFEDRAKLPYIEATVREALRWRSVLPLGIHHYTSQDDHYNGYFIPKGTICLSNLWRVSFDIPTFSVAHGTSSDNHRTINRDRKVYGIDADDFNPGRFMEDSAISKDGHWAYGFGHRTCVGRHVADNSLFLAIARLLWAANITPVKDTAGNPIIPNTMDTDAGGMVLRPKPFTCSIEHRFAEAQDVIKEAKVYDS